MLALVVLAPLQTGLAPARAGDGEPDLEEATQRGPLAQLGSEDRDTRVLAGGGDELGERGRRRVAVVVQQPDPLVVGVLRQGRRQVHAVAHRGGIAGRAGDDVECDVLAERDGDTVKATPELAREVAAEELANLRAELGDEAFAAGHWQQAHDLLLEVSLDEDYVDFLTLPAYPGVVDTPGVALVATQDPPGDPATFTNVALEEPLAAGQVVERKYLKLTIRFVPNEDGIAAPILSDWRVAFSCPPGE